MSRKNQELDLTIYVSDQSMRSILPFDPGNDVIGIYGYFLKNIIQNQLSERGIEATVNIEYKPYELTSPQMLQDDDQKLDQTTRDTIVHLMANAWDNFFYSNPEQDELPDNLFSGMEP